MSPDDLDIARAMAKAGVPIFLAEPAWKRGQWQPDGGHNGCGYWLPRGWERVKADPDVLDRWRPGVAVCALMGHGFDLVDFDPRNGGNPSALNGMMPTVHAVADTPSGGEHHFVPSLAVRSRDDVLPGVDVKAGDPDGEGRGFAFIAPTVRLPKGGGEPRPYVWRRPPDLEALAADDGGTCGPLRELVASRRSVPNAEGPFTTPAALAPSPWDDLAGILETNGRHSAVVKLASALRGRGGWRVEDALAYMRAVVYPKLDQQRGGHPYTLGEFEQDVRDVFGRYPDGTVAPVAPASVLGTTVAPLGVTWASEVTPRRARFAWAGRIPAGDLTLVVGRGGLGKTVAVGADLAARWSRGDLDGDLVGPQRVLISSAEDSPEHTLTPRLIAAGADLDRVGFVPPTLQIPDHVDQLADLVKEHAAAALVLDPLNAFLGFAIDSHRDKDLRVALGPLAAMAHETGCAVIAIGHVNKLRTGDAYALVSGSVAYYNGPRSVLVVAPDPEADDEDPSARVLVHAKSNLAAQAPPLRFRVASEPVDTVDGLADVPVVEWGDEVPHLSASDALAGLDTDERTAVDDAGEWLRNALAGGPRQATDVKAEARKAGHASRTLQRAAKRLQVVSRRQGFGESATWELPVRATVVPNTHTGATGATGSRGQPPCVDCGAPATCSDRDGRERCHDHVSWNRGAA